jgi:phosphoglycerol transferase MdoB-like AlkP superfamily enzyme
MDPTAKWSARHPNRKPHPTRPQQSSDGLYVSRCISKKESQESLSLSLFLCAMYYTTPDFCVCVCVCLDRFLFSSYLLPHTFFFLLLLLLLPVVLPFSFPFWWVQKSYVECQRGPNEMTWVFFFFFYFSISQLFFFSFLFVCLFPYFRFVSSFEFSDSQFRVTSVR